MPRLSVIEVEEIASFKQQWREAVAAQANELPSIAEQRSGFEVMNADVPLPADCAVAPAPWGFPGERIVPRGADETRALLYLHGGGHFFGSPGCYRHLVARIAESAGVTAVVPQYRLAPEHPFPAAIDDALAAYRELLDQGFDPKNIVVSGDSAGGNLAAALAVKVKMDGMPQPAGLYLISPWLDLTLSGEAYQARAAQDPLLTREAMARAAGLYLQGQAADDPLASPVFTSLVGLPPMLIHVGGDEILQSDSTAFTARAGLDGVGVSLSIWPEMVHAWPLFHHALGAGRRAIAEAGAWIAAQLSIDPELR
jgi:acetyl esterase/lipase